MTDNQFKALSKQLDKFLVPIKTIAVVQLAQELYSQAEREALIAEYSALETSDREAYDALQQASKEIIPPDLGFEERVRQFGQDEATRQIAPMTMALERRRETGGALNAFRDRHRLIARLMDCGASLGKSAYEE
jgi:hypothetical protein